MQTVFLFAWVVCLWVASAMGPCRCCAAVFVKSVVLGSEKPGVHIEIITLNPHGAPAVIFERLQLVHHGHRDILTKLTQLKGLVTLTSNQAALDFVRLRNGPRTWYLMSSSEPEEIEITQTGRHEKLALSGSGYLGVLSPSAFQAGGFQPPQVSHGPNSYTIKRWIFGWIFVRRYGKSGWQQAIKLVQEIVGRDGSYTRTVLTTRPVPRLPDTHWQFPMFK